MAVSHDSTASAQGGGVSSLSVSLTIANNSNRYIIVHGFAGHSGAPGAFSSSAWNTSEALSNLWATTVSGFGRMEAWGLIAPTATTANASINYGATLTEVGIIAGSYYGVHQTTATGTARTATGTGTSPRAWIGIDDGDADGLVVGAAGQNLDAGGTPTQAISNGIADYRAVGTSSQSAGATSRAPALPAGTQRGDLVIATCMSENNETHSCSTTGWNAIAQHNSGTSFTVSHWWALQDGSLSAPTITWTSSVGCGAKCATYIDTDPVTPIAALGTVGTGTTSTHTSTGGNTTENDVLAVYVDHCNANTALAQPAGWTENSDAGSATGPNRYTFGSKDIATSGTGSGNISETGGNAAWVQKQFEVYRGATTTHRDEEEDLNADGFNSFGVADEPGTAYNTLLWNMSGGATTWGAGAVALLPAASAVSLTAPKLASGSTLRAHTVTPVISATAPKLASASVLRASTVTPVITLTAPLLSSASALHAPSVAFALSAPKLASASALYAPSVAPVISVAPAKLASTSALYGPTLSLQISLSPAKLDSASVLRATSVALSLTAPKLASTSAFYGPTISVAGETTLSAPKLASASVLHAASITVSLSLSAPLLASASALYGPIATVESVVTPPAETPTGTTGGGGAAQFYRGRYRRDIRKAIRRALDELHGVRTSRSRKRRVRRIATAFVEEFAFDVPVVVFEQAPEVALLEPIRLQLVQVGQALRSKELEAAQARAKAEELKKLFALYEAEAKAIEEREDEEALALILAIAA